MKFQERLRSLQGEINARKSESLSPDDTDADERQGWPQNTTWRYFHNITEAKVHRWYPQCKRNVSLAASALGNHPETSNFPEYFGSVESCGNYTYLFTRIQQGWDKMGPTHKRWVTRVRLVENDGQKLSDYTYLPYSA